MKTKFLILTALLGSAFAFASCDDDHNYQPSGAVTAAFKAKYPNARRVEWESKAGYEKAECYIGSYESEVWFDRQGTWIMTETDIPYALLPQAVKTTHEAGQYGTWRVDDVDKIERYDTANMYVVEVERGETEVELHYTDDGALVKEIMDNDGNNQHFPSIIPEVLKNLVQELYPGAVILEVDSEGPATEIDILHDGNHKEVLVDAGNRWIRTEWEIRTNEVPEVVMTALRASAYASYRIDDVNVIENVDGRFYEFELEQGDREVTVMFSADGTQIS